MNRYFKLLTEIPHLLGANDDPIKIVQNENVIQRWQDAQRLKLSDKSHNLKWADIGVILDDPYVLVLRDLVEFPSGFCGGYIRLFNRAYLEKGAAGVVMLPEQDGKLLIMKNFRHATRNWHWEIPRGFGEPGISAEEQAREELKEEVGGDVAEIINLGMYFSNTGLDGNPINLFLARMISAGMPNWKAGIDKFLWVSVSEFEQMIASGEITDGFTIAAYTRATLRGLI